MRSSCCSSRSRCCCWRRASGESCAGGWPCRPWWASWRPASCWGRACWGTTSPRSRRRSFPLIQRSSTCWRRSAPPGMVLLLLLTGLETDLRLLRHLGRAALIASLMGMVFPFATGFGLGLLTAGRLPGPARPPDPVQLFPGHRHGHLGHAGHRQDPDGPGSDQAKHRRGHPVGGRGGRHGRLVGAVRDRRRGLARPCPFRSDAVHAGPDRGLPAVRRRGAVPGCPPPARVDHPSGAHHRTRIWCS